MWLTGREGLLCSEARSGCLGVLETVELELQWRSLRLLWLKNLGGCSVVLQFPRQFGQQIRDRHTMVGDGRLDAGDSLGIDHEDSVH